jgi:hypothetical protein
VGFWNSKCGGDTKGKINTFRWNAKTTKQKLVLGEYDRSNLITDEIYACKFDHKKCNRKICTNPEYKDLAGCKEWLPKGYRECKYGGKCNALICSDPLFKDQNWGYCK